jgi:hypothetical protein
MRKYLLILMALVIMVGSVIVYAEAKADATPASSPDLTVYPPIANLNKSTTVAILGAGFEPNTEMNILFYDGFGSIGALSDTVVSDDRGNFIVGWNLGRYTRRGILWQGVTSIMAADMDFNPIASSPIAFVDVSKKAADWPLWGKSATGVQLKSTAK